MTNIKRNYDWLATYYCQNFRT